MASIDHESGSVIRKALRAQYPLPQYAVLYEVASGMGKTFGGYADAMVMGLFPSRGLDIHGFEIKVSRADWLRELKKPDKAERVASYCDYFWLVIQEEGIAKVDEVPSPWGLYALDGKALKVLKRPKKLRAMVPDRAFIGSMLRRANEMAERERSRAEEELNKDEFVKKARKEAEKESKELFETELRMATREHESFKREVQEFEEASGIKINRWNGGRMGEAVKLLMGLTDTRDISEIERLSADIGCMAKRLEEGALQLKQVRASFVSAGKLPS